MKEPPPVRRCTWDCSSMHLGGSRLVELSRPIDYDGDPCFSDRCVRPCECGYCTSEKHQDRVSLPPCCHDSRLGALVTWGDECTAGPPHPLTLF